MEKIPTAELVRGLEDGTVRTADVRPIDAYNGWAIKGEPRGGHIPGARALPAGWTEQETWADVAGNKGLLGTGRVVVYGYPGPDAVEVAEKLRGAGADDVVVYDGFTDEWSPDESLPLKRMPRFDRLVPARLVAGLADGGTFQGVTPGRVAICHCHYRNHPDYEVGHIPGAVALDTLELESPDTWNRRSPEELERALTRLGITADTTVMVYGRFSSPSAKDPHPGSKAGHLASFRCAAIMMYAGVRDVRVINGGMAAWGAEGLPLSREEVRLDPAGEFGGPVPARPELFIDTPRAKEILASGDGKLVSVRSWPEFIGAVSGYNYIFKKGRIPGAVFGNCGSDAYHMENYRNLDLTTREYPEIEAMWRASGITPDRFSAFCCGTGWRASEAMFNAYLMGWDDVAVYDGGWFEWSSDPSNPVATGIPDDKG